MNALALFPVAAAALVPMLVGHVWFHPNVFGRMWMSSKHITPDMAERSASGQYLSYATLFVAGALTSGALYMMASVLRMDSSVDALALGSAAWFTISLPSLLNSAVWNRVPVRVFLIESGQWLVSLVLMARIVMM